MVDKICRRKEPRILYVNFKFLIEGNVTGKVAEVPSAI